MSLLPTIREPGRLLFTYALLALAFCHEFFVPGHSLFRWDALLYTWPIQLEARALLLSGHMPFWSDSLCAGTPLLENINAGLLYPPKLLLWFLPIRLGFSIFLTAHVWISLVAMHALVERGLRAGRAGAFIAAVVYAFNGYARSTWDTHHFVAMPWIPLLFLALLRARDGAWLRCALCFAFAWAMTVFSGDLQATAMASGFAVILAVLHPSRRTLIPCLGVGLLAGLLLSACQWLPAMAYASESYRAAGLNMAEALERSFHPKRLWDLVVPYAFGNRDTWDSPGLMGEGATKLTPWTSSIHLGLLTLVPLIASLRLVRRNAVVWLWIVALGGLLLSFGRFLPGYELWQQLPVVSSFRYPEKYLLWFVFGAAALAGASLPFLLRVGRRWLPRKRAATAWAAITLVSMIPAWFIEQPATNRFDPLQPPVIAQQIRDSDEPFGRFLRDRAVDQFPLPDMTGWRATEKQSMYYLQSLHFNSPRAWGLRTAEGFSPAESAAMRERRLSDAASEGTNVASVVSLAAFCKDAGVTWLLTTPSRLVDLQTAGLAARAHETFGGSDSLVLARVDAQEAWIAEGDAGVVSTRRSHSGAIRIDLVAGGASLLHVAETYAPGWRAIDEEGRALATERSAGAFLGVRIPAGATQVRLTYEPVMWRTGLLLTILGIIAVAAVGFAAFPVARRVSPVPVALLVATMLVLMAALSVSCTFDEPFHVSRGLTRVAFDDARLCYFHPPLQNVACAYTALLAHGDRLVLPQAVGWEAADVMDYAVDLIVTNPVLWPDLVQASRWGSLLFLLILVGVGVRWARAAGGPLAGWLAAAGLALQPALLAHGFLTTTDVGLCALVIAGTWATWEFHRTNRSCWLYGAAAFYVLACMVKYSALVWLGSFLVLVVLHYAFWRKRPALALVLPFAVILGAGLLLVLYGTTPQLVRGEGGWWSGLTIPAGRYLEGLVRQTDHALSGHRAFFHGERITHATWWTMAAVVVVKTPLLWCAGGVVGVVAWLGRRDSLGRWIPWVPATVFVLLLLSANNLALGIRHALPIVVIAVVAASVFVARLADRSRRLACAGALVLSSFIPVATTFPSFLAYFPMAFGGRSGGHAWLVDSNYDWGQDAGALEEQWAGLTKANGGRPLRLIYYGFMDPAYVYGLPVADGSYLGAMSWRGAIRRGELELWQQGVASGTGPVVASVSAVRVGPHGLEFPEKDVAGSIGRIADSYFVMPGTP